jgi:hypothetical protein
MMLEVDEVLEFEIEQREFGGLGRCKWRGFGASVVGWAAQSRSTAESSCLATIRTEKSPKNTSDVYHEESGSMQVGCKSCRRARGWREDV